jgi:defect-in-organelle-trafficking protein DotC
MKKLLLTITAIIAFSGSAYASTNNPTPSLQTLMNMQHIEGKGSGPIDGELSREHSLQVAQMKESATVLGIHSGFNYELERLQNALKTVEGDLDGTFDFGTLMRSTNTGQFEAFLLPGIVAEKRGSVVVSDDGKNLSYTESSFEILFEERFVIDQPNWRNYLLLNPFKKYQSPFNDLLPKNEEEAKVWRDAIKEGWELGVMQANQELIAYSENLRRDFIGMVKYMRLSLEGKINTASLAFTRKLVESDGMVMNINKSDYQISSPARFNPKNGEWEIIPLSTRGSLRKTGEMQ